MTESINEGKVLMHFPRKCSVRDQHQKIHTYEPGFHYINAELAAVQSAWLAAHGAKNTTEAERDALSHPATAVQLAGANEKLNDEIVQLKKEIADRDNRITQLEQAIDTLKKQVLTVKPSPASSTEPIDDDESELDEGTDEGSPVPPKKSARGKK